MALRAVSDVFLTVVFVSLPDSKVLNCYNSRSWFIGGLTVHQRILLAEHPYDKVPDANTPEQFEYVVLVDQFVSGDASPVIELSAAPLMECKFPRRRGRFRAIPPMKLN